MPPTRLDPPVKAVQRRKDLGVCKQLDAVFEKVKGPTPSADIPCIAQRAQALSAKMKWLESHKPNRELWKPCTDDLPAGVPSNAVDDLIGSPSVGSTSTEDGSFDVKQEVMTQQPESPRERDEKEAANIYDDYIQSAVKNEAVVNSNLYAQNARIRAKDSLDDFDVSVEMGVPVRTHAGAYEDAADVMMECDAQIMQFLKKGEEMLRAEHAFSTVAADVERCICQLTAIATSSPLQNLRPSTTVQHASLANALKARDMFYRQASRIRKMAAQQHHRNFVAQMALLPHGSDRECRAVKKRRSREKKEGKKETKK